MTPNDADLETNNNNNNKDKDETEMVTAMVDEETSTLFIEKCMEYGLAVGAGVEVAAVLAFTRSKMIAGERDQGVPVMIEQVIYLKPILGNLIPPNYCGNYSVDNVVDTIVPKDQDFEKHFWTIAQDVNNSMASNMHNALPVLYVPPPQTPEEVEQQKSMSEMEPEDKDTTFPNVIAPSTSDPEKPPENPLDQLDDKDYGKMRVSSMGLIGKTSNDKIVELTALHGLVGFRKTYGPGLSFIHTAVDSKICLTVSYKKDIYNRAQIIKMVNKAKDFLQQALTFDPPGAAVTTSQNESESFA